MTSKTSSRIPLPHHLAPEVAYLVLDMALEKYGMPPSKLSYEHAEPLLAIAQDRFKLEQRMLASDSGQTGQVPSSTIEEAVTKIRGRYESDAEFLTDLERNQMSLEGLRVALGHSLRVEAVRSHVRQQVPEVDETDASLYYVSHHKDFELPETRTASHILITINPAFPENTKHAARERIHALREQIVNDPSSFETLAQRHSECPTALQEGKLGRLRRGSLYPALDQTLFTLAEGELSPVKSSPLGLHILRCDRIHPARVIEEETALPRIREMLTKRQQDTYEKAWLESLQTSRKD